MARRRLVATVAGAVLVAAFALAAGITFSPSPPGGSTEFRDEHP